MSADGVIFNNGYSNNQVIFSLRDDLKNGRVFKKGAKPLEKSQFIDTGTSMNGDLDINKNIQNFVEYLLNPETQQRIASIDAELGTKYGEAAKRFVRRYNNGELLVYPRNKGDIGIYDDIINKSRTVSDDGVLVTKDFDRIAFEILRNDPSHVPGHEAKHGIELLQAALLKDMTPAEYYQYAKTGVPNFKSVDEIDRLINNNPYVGTSENNGLRNLRIMFNYIIKDKNEFMRRFNKYGFSTAVGVPTAATINNNDNGK